MKEIFTSRHLSTFSNTYDPRTRMMKMLSYVLVSCDGCGGRSNCKRDGDDQVGRPRDKMSVMTKKTMGKKRFWNRNALLFLVLHCKHWMEREPPFFINWLQKFLDFGRKLVFSIRKKIDFLNWKTVIASPAPCTCDHCHCNLTWILGKKHQQH